MADARAEEFVAYSATNKDQPAEEDPSIGHGLFTYALIKRLGGPARSTDSRELRVYTLGDYLSNEVRTLSQGGQTPEFWPGSENYLITLLPRSD